MNSKTTCCVAYNAIAQQGTGQMRWNRLKDQICPANLISSL